jgi:hypothetical protein
MEKLKHSFKNSFVILFLGGALLTSCSEETPDSIPMEASDPDTTDSAAVADHVLAWEEMRQDSNSVKSWLKKLSNTFTLVRPSLSVDSIHIYIGFDADNQKFWLYSLSAIADTGTNINCLSSAELIVGPKDSLSITSAQKGKNSDGITITDAKLRINRWRNDAVRNSWISAVFKDTEKHEMGQVFSMNTEDMIVGDSHTCYLSLKLDPLIEGGYRGDIVVVNTSTNEIIKTTRLVDLGATVVLEDVVKLGPPFKNLNREDFGVLKILGIR